MTYGSDSTRVSRAKFMMLRRLADPVLPRVRPLVLALVISASAGAQAHEQTHRDTIRGTVTTDSGKVITAADVIVTMAPARLSASTQTDSTGHYSLVFDHGSGDYLVHISAMGRDTFRKRVTRTGTDSVFTVDAVLARTGAAQLSAVKVTAEKPMIGRDDSRWGMG
ncbi:MAG: carboxypeptidase-like regulatory domain-containing protein, partial [Gemmatimonadaceae bacterium]